MPPDRMACIASTTGLTGETGPAGPEGPAGPSSVLGLVLVNSLGDARLTMTHAANAWFTLPNRVVTINKVSSTSKLRITYQDTLGTRSSAMNICHWRIVVDGATTVSSFSNPDVEGSLGWRMSNGAHVAWAFNLPAGSHQVRVDNLKTSTSAECWSGFNTTTSNFLSVEEIP